MDYKTYHYGDNNINDNGWGCSYRNIQTLISCYKYYYDKYIEVPCINEIVSFFDKDLKTNKLNDLWLEPYEISIFLKKYCNNFDGNNYLFIKNDNDVSRILKTDIAIYTKGDFIINDFNNFLLIIKKHFNKYKIPIIIDDGIYSYCFILLNDQEILLIDPHITNDNNVKKIKIDFLIKNFWMIYVPIIQ